MAAPVITGAINGKKVIWGLPTADKTAALVPSGSGIVETFERASATNKEEITDEVGDYKTRVDHGHTKKFSFAIKAVAASTTPAKGAELAIVGLSGRTFVDDAKAAYEGAGVKKITVSATNYPDMAANA